MAVRHRAIGILLSAAPLALALTSCGSDAPAAVPTSSGFALAPITIPASVVSADDCNALTDRGERIHCLIPLAEEILAQAYAPVVESRGITFVRPMITTDPGGTETACGKLTRTTYCPDDQTIYLPIDSMTAFGDTAAQEVDWSPEVLDYFSSQLTAEQMSTSGPYGEVMALAHEYGHHVQNLIGMVAINSAGMIAHPEETARLSSELELTADCFAGWIAGTADAADAYQVEPPDQWAAVTALAEVGDDFISESRGVSAEESARQPFNHGAANERANAWVTGVGLGLDGVEPYAACVPVVSALISGRSTADPSPSTS